MNKIQILLVLIMTLLMSSIFATEIIHYNKKAVVIELHKGVERTIHFGDHVEVGITKGMQEKQLFRVQSAQGSLHILSYEAFDKQRVQVRRLGDNQVLLLDFLSTDSKEPLEDIKIIMPYENKIEQMSEGSDLGSHLGLVNKRVITPVDLTRFLAQKLYGPTRLHNEQEGISPSIIAVKGPIKLFKGKQQLSTVSNVVLASQGGGYYISALYIRNMSDERLRLNYLDLNIPFSHATFQHHSLNANGQSGDSTILYLVSQQPMKDVLYPFSYYSDVNSNSVDVERRRAE